jgi:hypothetical protein
VTPTRDVENPPNARHWCEHVPHGPKRSSENLPSEAKIQMVRLQVFNKNALKKLQEKCESDSWNSWNAITLLRTHKVNGTRQPILVIAKARNQIDDIDLKDEIKDAEILNPKAACMTISRLHL